MKINANIFNAKMQSSKWSEIMQYVLMFISFHDPCVSEKKLYTKKIEVQLANNNRTNKRSRKTRKLAKKHQKQTKTCQTGIEISLPNMDVVYIFLSLFHIFGNKKNLIKILKLTH